MCGCTVRARIDTNMITRTNDIPHSLHTVCELLGIQATHYEHKPLFSAADGTPDFGGLTCKNLFLRNEQGKLFLVTLSTEDMLDIKAFWKSFETGRLSFASADLLESVLGVKPGSVTPLALMNDHDRRVTFFLDQQLVASEYVACHPLRNDRSTVMKSADLLKFCRYFGHTVCVVMLPKKIKE